MFDVSRDDKLIDEVETSATCDKYLGLRVK